MYVCMYVCNRMQYQCSQFAQETRHIVTCLRLRRSVYPFLFLQQATKRVTHLISSHNNPSRFNIPLNSHTYLYAQESDLAVLLGKFLDCLPNSKCLTLHSAEGAEIVSIACTKEETQLLGSHVTSLTNSNDHVSNRHSTCFFRTSSFPKTPFSFYPYTTIGIQIRCWKYSEFNDVATQHQRDLMAD